jgi:NAD(P)-dependent dehydrogenase (short-subunit alcohol dehydrogenase family)
MIGLITGGSRGLGKDIAITFAQDGHDVIITYQNKADDAAAVVAQIEKLGRKALALQLDVGDVKSFDAFLSSVQDALGSTFRDADSRLDFVVHNAGMGATIPIAQATEDDFDKFSNVQLKGVFFLTQKMLPILRDGGSIITISSRATRFVNPGYALYASMKSGVEAFTRYLAKEVGPRGIRANCVAPGTITTDFNDAIVRSPQMQGTLKDMTPLGRVGQPDDISGVVVFLCSPAAKWVNGQRIEVSGGIYV